jgi:hypothetical protein
MRRNQQKISAGGATLFWCVLLNAIVLEQGLVANPNWYWLLLFSIPHLLGCLVAFSRRKL